ncbi:uncharacterized protein At4g15970-like isoform X2 [Wolffia australiana]
MRTLLVSLLVVAGLAFLYALTIYDVSVFNFLPASFRNPNNTSISESFRKDDCPNSDSDVVKLKKILERAALADKTVILTTVNDAWMAPGSVLDLFLESFWTGERTSGLLKHLIIIAVDEKAYEKCRLTHVHCYALKTEGVDFSADQKIMMEDYRKLMWARINFLRFVLELGYNFIFTDVDVIWFRDPTPFFSTRNYDFQTACDYFHGNPDDTFNTANGGFNFVRSNNRTQLFYKYWYESRLRHPGLHDQDVLNLIKTEPYRYDIGLSWKMLPTDKFGGLCQPSRDFEQVYTMHVNCCIGLESKLNDLRLIMEDWRMYKALTPSQKTNHTNKWRAPQRC